MREPVFYSKWAIYNMSGNKLSIFCVYDTKEDATEAAIRMLKENPWNPLFIFSGYFATTIEKNPAIYKTQSE